jgi:hypothetical protein
VAKRLCRLSAVLVLLFSLSPVAVASAVTYDAQPAPSWVPNGRVYAIATDGERVIIGGSFTRVKNPATGKWVARERLAAFDATTGDLDLSWNPGTDGVVRALAIGPDGVVYAGGGFSNAGGLPATRLAAISPSGAGVPGFSAAPSGTVRDLALVEDGLGGSDLFVAGTFGTVNGVSRVGVAKLDPASGAVRSWNARVGMGRVVALDVDTTRNQLVIGGNFKKIAGADVWFLAGVDLGTAKRTAWTPPRICDSCNVLDVVVAGDTVFGAAAGGGGGRAASWSAVADTRLWVKRADGDVQAVDHRDGVVYAGGHFSMDFDGFERHQLAALDAVTGQVLPYVVPFTGLDDPGIWVIRAEETQLRIGGGFQGISGSSAMRYAVLSAVPPPATS